MGRLEGSGPARIIKMMQEQGYNEDVRFHVATVSSVSPFAIRIAGDTFDIEEDSLYISQSILPHTRTVLINGSTSTIEYQEGYISVGDKVQVIETNDGQKYFVQDKVVG